jgi:hypothetical protein
MIESVIREKCRRESVPITVVIQDFNIRCTNAADEALSLSRSEFTGTWIDERSDRVA